MNQSCPWLSLKIVVQRRGICCSWVQYLGTNEVVKSSNSSKIVTPASLAASAPGAAGLVLGGCGARV